MRLVSAGISSSIARRVLPLAALLAIVLAAPAAADVLPAQGTQVVQPASGAVQQTLDQASTAAAAATAPATQATAPAAQALAPVRDAADQAVARTRAAAPAPAPRNPAPPAAGESVTGAVERTQAVSDAVTRTAGEPARELAKRVPPAPAPVDDLLRSLGESLRSLGIDSLAAPLTSLLAGTGLADLAPVRPAVGGLLPAGEPPRPASHFALDESQSASAQPPAAEVGGRPESSSPRMAPALTADGAAAASTASASAAGTTPAALGTAPGSAAPAGSGGFGFAPLLGLLVLAALAVPRLLRRLDALPALVRPAPLVCALERPG